jgi:hypothetical protein
MSLNLHLSFINFIAIVLFKLVCICVGHFVGI